VAGSSRRVPVAATKKTTRMAPPCPPVIPSDHPRSANRWSPSPGARARSPQLRGGRRRQAAQAGISERHGMLNARHVPHRGEPAKRPHFLAPEGESAPFHVDRDPKFGLRVA